MKLSIKLVMQSFLAICFASHVAIAEEGKQSSEEQQVSESEIPNILVIKVPVDEDGQELTEESTLLPVSIAKEELQGKEQTQQEESQTEEEGQQEQGQQENGEGESEAKSIDWKRISELALQQEGQVAEISLSKSEVIEESDLPEVVQKELQALEQEFQEAGAQQSEVDDHVAWRVHAPWGTIGNRGFYGYGWKPHYGYSHSNRVYHPRYGYYDGNRYYRYRTAPFYRSYRHNDRYYNYYYRY